jgi:hypothetical protein
MTISFYMKKLYTSLLSINLLILAVSQISCKKFIQNQEQKAILNAVTNGLWYVEGYKQNDSDLTASFSGYLFKFDQNNTVTGTRNAVSASGSWMADIGARTIMANFPGAGDPLIKLNRTWKIKDSYTDYVVANYTDTMNNTLYILQLRKQ